MNKKGFEMAISTIVIIIIAIAVLAGLILLVTKGFGIWKSGVDPIANSATVAAIKETCNLACRTEDAITFCCERFSIDTGKVLCTDSGLNVDCDLSCAAVTCLAD